MLETLESIIESTQKWKWEDMCGRDGFHPWNPKTRDFGFCFQRLFLIIPVFYILAIISAYYAGKQTNWVVRGKLQIYAINVRCIIVFCLTVIPFIQGYLLLIRKNTIVVPIDYFTLGTECITWFIHFAFMLAMRRRLGVSPRGPTLILVVWSAAAVLSIVSLRSVVLQGRPYWEELSVVILQVFYLFTLIPGEGVTNLASTLIGSEYAQIGEQEPLLYHFIDDEDVLGTAMADTPFLSKLIFYWVDPLFSRGLKNKLKDPEDLFDLPENLSCSIISTKMEKALIGNVDRYQRNDVNNRNTSLNGSYGGLGESSNRSTIPNVQVISPKWKYNVSLLRALHSCFGLEFYSIGILRLISDVSGFAGPLLLNKLVLYVEDPSIDINQGYLLAFGLLLASLISAFSDAHFNMYMAIVTLKLRAAIISTVFRKSLNVTSTNLNKQFNHGEITNFISTDTDRIVNSCPSFHAVWSIPLQIIVTLYLLHNQVGVAFLSGVVLTIVLIPINKYVANKIGQLSTKLMKYKDDRVNLMTEIIKGIRTIKLHAWEDFFIDRIKGFRQNEIKYLKGRKYLDAICVFLWATTPILVSTLTLTTYVLLGNKLNAATVFTTIALLNMLISPLNAFPWVLNGVTEAWVSVKRIQRLLDLEDFNPEEYTRIHKNRKIVLSMRNATFSWIKAMKSETAPTKIKSKKGKSSKNAPSKHQRSDSLTDDNNLPQETLIKPFQLRGLSFYVNQGDFVGIIGKVGSGKTSLLNAILGEMIKLNGEITSSDIDMGIGYVSQKPWLQRGTIINNILFGKAYEETKYRRVIDACGLTEDISLLGSRACIGEGGCTLSGGQAARVALARAVYQNKEVYLLDDILSAVDNKVGAHIFDKCLMGLLKDKTRILVTHSLSYVAQADHVVVLENGMIAKQGTPREVIDDIEDYLSMSDEEVNGNDVKLVSDTSIENFSMRIDKTTESIQDNETSASGDIDFWVIKMYWKSMGHWLAIAILISLALMQTSRNITDLWLSFWVSPPNATNMTSFDDEMKPLLKLPYIDNMISHNRSSIVSIENVMNYTENLVHNFLNPIQKLPLNNTVQDVYEKTPSNATDDHVMYYLSIYMGLAAINSLCTLIRSFLFAYGGIHAAIKIHKSLLKSVMKAKMVFFDLTSAGSLMNRFSSDTYTVDDSLPFIMNILLAQMFGILGSLIVTAYGLPWICLVIVPLIPIYHWLQYRYRLTSRELKRLSSVTLSPIYSHFNDTLDGAIIIKAHGKVSSWERTGEHLIERCQRAMLCSSVAAQWLGIRLRFMGAAVLTGTAVVAVAQRNLDFVDPGLVGLVITYSLTVTSLLGGVINAFTETEREMIAVERIGEYITTTTQEDSYSDYLGSDTLESLRYGWPSTGVICFNNVIMKYRPHLAPSLRGISFETFPGEKIGVVGRTGAGKSSLFAALFRLCELTAGNIIIDGVDICEIPPTTLRSRLAIIPQEPFIFNGSIRENLDPLNEHEDNKLWKAVEKCGARQVIQNRGGLDSPAKDLSRGNMQLICLARAILQNAKILCIDEATANVDQETDRLIQEVIKCCFPKSTVLTIAHRLSTVMASNRVMVMSEGQIVGLDTPDNLISDPNPYFCEMINN